MDIRHAVTTPPCGGIVMRRAICCCGLIAFFASLATAGAQNLPPGFASIDVATGLTSPTCFCVAPDDTVYVALQNGAVRIWREATGLLPTQVFVNAPLSVHASAE